MKAKLNNKKSSTRIYPSLLECNVGHIVVLAVKPNDDGKTFTGVVLYSPSHQGYVIGHVSTAWDVDAFVNYIGDVIISSD